MPGRLEDKVAIITGGAGYIGTAITQAFCREGARVVIADFDASKFDDMSAKLSAAERARVSFIKTDACDDTQLRSMAAQVVAEHGRIDVLVAMVGGSKDALIHKMTDEQWDQVIDLNLRSLFLSCRAIVPHMMERQYGKIVLMSSRSYLGNIGQVNYAAAKAGVIGFANSLSREMARYRVNVNAVVPGFVDNPRLANMPEKYRQMRIELNPFQTAAEPKDVAEVILFLASDEARQVTGQAIRVACW
ncbi:MAG: SDR family oxidoreductase [Chloroflexi bacterium]|nr:SDR family oxidoreductase [Chloroflexota bacterium]